jgi:hypothetical protein
MSRSTRDAAINSIFDEHGLPTIPQLKDPYEWVSRSYLCSLMNYGWVRGFFWGIWSGMLFSVLILIAFICAWGLHRIADQRDALFQQLFPPPVVHPIATPQLRKD